MSASSQRDVGASVDHHERTRAASALERLVHQREQRAIVEVALADLNQIDAGSCRRVHRVQQTLLRHAIVAAVQPPVRDETQDRAMLRQHE